MTKTTVPISLYIYYLIFEGYVFKKLYYGVIKGKS